MKWEQKKNHEGCIYLSSGEFTVWNTAGRWCVSVNNSGEEFAGSLEECLEYCKNRPQMLLDGAVQDLQTLFTRINPYEEDDIEALMDSVNNVLDCIRARQEPTISVLDALNQSAIGVADVIQNDYLPNFDTYLRLRGIQEIGSTARALILNDLEKAGLLEQIKNKKGKMTVKEALLCAHIPHNLQMIKYQEKAQLEQYLYCRQIESSDSFREMMEVVMEDIERNS